MNNKETSSSTSTENGTQPTGKITVQMDKKDTITFIIPTEMRTTDTDTDTDTSDKTTNAGSANEISEKNRRGVFSIGCDFDGGGTNHDSDDSDEALRKIIHEEHKKTDPDLMLRSLYGRIKVNQKFWQPHSETFKVQNRFIIELVNAIKRLEGCTLKKATQNQLINFVHELTTSGNLNRSTIFRLIKCTRKSKHFEHWEDYKLKFCLDWDLLIDHLTVELHWSFNIVERKRKKIVELLNELRKIGKPATNNSDVGSSASSSGDDKKKKKHDNDNDNELKEIVVEIKKLISECDDEMKDFLCRIIKSCECNEKKGQSGVLSSSSSSTSSSSSSSSTSSSSSSSSTSSCSCSGTGNNSNCLKKNNDEVETITDEIEKIITQMIKRFITEEVELINDGDGDGDGDSDDDNDNDFTKKLKKSIDNGNFEKSIIRKINRILYIDGEEYHSRRRQNRNEFIGSDELKDFAESGKLNKIIDSEMKKILLLEKCNGKK